MTRKEKDAQLASVITTYLTGKILTAKDPFLEVWCMRMAAGIGFGGTTSMRRVARMYGVTVSHVSSKTKHYRETLDLPLNGFNKSAEAIQTYKLTNKRTPKIP